MKEDGKDKTWKDKTGRKYQAYGVEQRSEQKKSDELEEEVAEVKSEDSIPSIAKENEIEQDDTSTKDPDTSELDLEEEGEEVEFDLEAHHADAHKRGLRTKKIMSAEKKPAVDYMVGLVILFLA